MTCKNVYDFLIYCLILLTIVSVVALFLQTELQILSVIIGATLTIISYGLKRRSENGELKLNGSK